MKDKSSSSFAFFLAAVWLSGCAAEAPQVIDTRDDVPAAFVGRAVCGECHAAEAESWRGSHHDLAMQEANEANVLGDFDGTSFEQGGVTTTFSRRDAGYFVRTDGPDGELQEYRITHTFGAEPLQQYLIDFDKAGQNSAISDETAEGVGALQALPIAWDTRPAAEGGQRWFHLYEESIAPGDPLHWTGPLQNWNYMCAGCHSTGLVRGYDAAAQRFDTRWAEIDVSCEACHGPGSRHVTAARAGDAGGSGLVTRLRRSGRWAFADGEPTARLVDADEAAIAARAVQTDACGRCHSRRTPVAPFEHGDSLHDTFSVSLLEPSFYHADGQILDEVYVYGSFLQSKMHAAGVTCSDCHEPHGAGLLQSGNAVCTQCHQGRVYDVPEHHHHPVGGAGAACVDCHMPARDYMVVDPRRDHSFRVPRPDLSASLGTPNACTSCHGDRDAAWAAETVASWGAQPGFHYGEALHAARTWQGDAEDLLLRTLEDSAQPPIVRASALAALRPFLSPASLLAVERSLGDPHPLVRGGALAALEDSEPAIQRRLAVPLTEDPARSVRLQAARLLAWAAAEGSVSDLPDAEASALFGALDEYRGSLSWRADRPDSHLHLGDLEARLGNATGAEAAYDRALDMLPSMAAAAINQADLYRATGRDKAGLELLRQALEENPRNAALHQALGLARIRLGRPQEALAALRQAYELAPEVPRYAYVYGIALHDLGDRQEGLRVLEQAQRRFPGNRELVAGYRALAGSSAAAGAP